MGGDLRLRFEFSPGHSLLIFQYILSLYKCHFEYRKTRTSVSHYRGSGYRARTQTLCATPLISGALVTNAAPCADLSRASMAHVFDLMLSKKPRIPDSSPHGCHAELPYIAGTQAWEGVARRSSVFSRSTNRTMSMAISLMGAGANGRDTLCRFDLELNAATIDLGRSLRKGLIALRAAFSMAMIMTGVANTGGKVASLKRLARCSAVTTSVNEPLAPTGMDAMTVLLCTCSAVRAVQQTSRPGHLTIHAPCRRVRICSS